MELVFNGAPLPEGIGVLGWSVSSPALSVRSVDLPGMRGRLRTGAKLGARGLTVRVVLLGNGTEENIRLLDALQSWCFSEEPAPLFLPGRADRYLLAECDGYPHPDAGKMQTEFEITFVAHMPEYLSAQEYSCPSDGYADMGGTLSAPVRMESVLAEAVSDPVWMTDGAQHIIRLSGSVPAGLLIIDTESGVVTLDGMDISDQITLDSDPAFMLAPGRHSFVFPSGVSGTVYWRERML